MFEPALTGSGLSLLVTDKSAAVLTVVIWVESLFAGLGSAVVVVTLAVLLIVVPLVVEELMFTTSVNVAVAPAARVALVAVTVPVPPTAGVVSVNAGPEVCIIETNVVFVGVESVSEMFWASLGRWSGSACR